MTVIVSITNRLSGIYDDGVYRRELKRVMQELIELVGPIISGSDYPVLAVGEGWRIKFGVPKQHQLHYVEFDSEELASFYILKYGGEIVSE